MAKKKLKNPYKAWRKYRDREETCSTLHKEKGIFSTVRKRSLASGYFWRA